MIDTHTHTDHFSATLQLAWQLGVPVVMHRVSPAPFVDMRVGDGEMVALGRLRLQAIHTPGHTQDSMCLRLEDPVRRPESRLGEVRCRRPVILVRFAPMPSSSVRAVALTPHPDIRHDAVRGVAARVARTAEVLAVTYLLEGELDRICLPAPAPRCVTDKLWQHTCFEIFIARKGAPDYYEFNLAPSGAWAVYAFGRYRERAALDKVSELDPHIAVRRAEKKLELDTLIPLDRLSPAHARGALVLALSTVIEHRDGSLSYWALRHPPGKPDFHHPEAFALELDEIRH